jgi:hypothetical protein
MARLFPLLEGPLVIETGVSEDLQQGEGVMDVKLSVCSSAYPGTSIHKGG